MIIIEPKIGERRQGWEIDKSLGNKYIAYFYIACPQCSIPRWVRETHYKRNPDAICQRCKYPHNGWERESCYVYDLGIGEILRRVNSSSGANCAKCGGNVFTRNLDNDEVCIYCGKVKYAINGKG